MERMRISEASNVEVFKRITIELSGPICPCNELDLVWWTENNTLSVQCRYCGTKLHVPRERIVASFKLDKAYPELKLPHKAIPSWLLKGASGKTNERSR